MVALSRLMVGLVILAALALISAPEPTEAGPVFGVIRTVNSADDVNDGACNAAHCSLREAINSVNGAGPGSEIKFNLANCPPACTISPQSPLPQITNQGLSISGQSEPDFAGDPLIVVDGIAQGMFSVLRTINANVSIHSLQVSNGPSTGISASAGTLAIRNSVVAGNASDGVSDSFIAGAVALTIIESSVTNNGGSGIVASSATTVIEDTVVTGNTGDGVFAGFVSVAAFTLRGSSIMDNGSNGIRTAGDTILVEDNTVSGNEDDGIDSAFSGVGSVTISGNTVADNTGKGIDTSGEDVEIRENVVSSNGGDGIATGGGDTATRQVVNNEVTSNEAGGIIVFAADLTVSGNTVSGNAAQGISARGEELLAISGNVVTGNGDAGVVASGRTGAIADNTITGNGAGVVGASTDPRPGLLLNGEQGYAVTGNDITGNAGHGIEISDSGNTVGGASQQDANVITGNGGSGVRVNDLVMDPQGNSVIGNTIHNNAGLGIDIDPAGPNVNDPLDPDTGPNGLQNHPLLATAESGSVTVAGTLNSVPSTGFRIEVFHNVACDGSGFGEGQTLLGDFEVTTNGAGNATINEFFGGAPGSGFITATATNNTTGDTSEFSNCIPIQAPATPTPSPSPSASPTATATPTSTPSATPTQTAAATPTPTPTAAPGEFTWGDHNCSGAADPIDSLLTLRHDADLGADTGDCPEFGTALPASGPQLVWGDVDCDGGINAIDALKLLRFDAGLSVEQEEGCPEIGDEVTQ
jgi:CSLREA domain-containing protein